MSTTTDEQSGASFRDPAGFIFRRNGVLYRQINESYAPDYQSLMTSGLYERLVDEGLLVSHHEVAVEPASRDSAWKVIQPEPVPFVSYPYEWCFGALRDAALTTLRIQTIAMDHGMSLRDATAFNIQFVGGRPRLIDTLSFGAYHEGEPWVAYRQFCTHFLAPLALAQWCDIRLLQLARVHLDGIPLQLTSRLLPLRTRLRLSLLLHIHIHARSERHFERRPLRRRNDRVNRKGLLGILSNLESAITRSSWRHGRSPWGDYYSDTNYSERGSADKEQAVSDMLDTIQPRIAWDLGANDGRFSRLCAKRDIPTIAFDGDSVAVESCYSRCKNDGESRILPLILDLTNPSPALGWAHNERMSLLERGPADTVLALALIHHLAIGNNLPFDRIASFFSRIGRNLIIEFVPKTDSQVQRLLATREDIFPGYHLEGFRDAFARHFEILAHHEIIDSERIVYLMRRRTESGDSHPLRD